MDISFLFEGILIGVTIAAPVGPIGVLCISRTLVSGRWSGIATGLGAATADMIYGALGALGVSVIVNFISASEVCIRILGGSFLIYLALKTLYAHDRDISTQEKSKGLARDYISSLFLTLTNPATIVFFLALFATLGLAGASGTLASALLVVLGVFLGSLGWWIFLSVTISSLKSHIQGIHMRAINILSGLILIGFAVYALWGVF